MGYPGSRAPVGGEGVWIGTEATTGKGPAPAAQWGAPTRTGYLLPSQAQAATTALLGGT